MSCINLISVHSNALPPSTANDATSRVHSGEMVLIVVANVVIIRADCNVRIISRSKISRCAIVCTYP